MSPPPVGITSPTTILILLNVAVFAAMVLKGLSPWDPRSDQLLQWGANFGPLTLDGQWWRLITSMFVHIGVLHLLVNMWGLWALGRAGEFLYGNRKYLGLYLLSGVGGSVASLVRDSTTVSAGASGALFGIAGALVAGSIMGGTASPVRLAPEALRSLMMVIGANLAFGLLYSRIDNGAHLGGLITGFLLGTALSHEETFTKRLRVPAPVLVFPLAGVLLGGMAFYLREVRYPQIKITLGNQAMQRGDLPAAIHEFQGAVELDPTNAGGHEALGTAYALAGRVALARTEYERALQLNPASTVLRRRLAVLHLQEGNPTAALPLLKEIIQKDPRDAQAYLQLGIAMQQAGEDEQALGPLQKAIALQPDLAPAFEALGNSYLHLQRYTEAVAALQQAHKINPRNAGVLMALANAFEGSGMFHEADEAYRQAHLLRQPRRQN